MSGVNLDLNIGVDANNSLKTNDNVFLDIIKEQNVSISDLSPTAKEFLDWTSSEVVEEKNESLSDDAQNYLDWIGGDNSLFNEVPSDILSDDAQNFKNEYGATIFDDLDISDLNLSPNIGISADWFNMPSLESQINFDFNSSVDLSDDAQNYLNWLELPTIETPQVADLSDDAQSFLDWINAPPIDTSNKNNDKFSFDEINYMDWAGIDADSISF